MVLSASIIHHRARAPHSGADLEPDVHVIHRPPLPASDSPAVSIEPLAAAGSQTRPSLLGALPDDLVRAIAPLPAGDRPFRARQLFGWLHARRARDFASMTNLPALLRERLASEFSIPALTVVEEQRSQETETRKFVLVAADGARIETVRIATPGRLTLCLSSQVGCGFGCRFCRTAQMGFVRNLSPAEIVDQVYGLDAIAPLPERFNIVFMGMGEPMANLDAVIRAIDILTHKEGLALSARRITLSTVGVVPGIRRLARERPKVRLAVSLGATTDPQRNELMPVNRRYAMEALATAMREHAERSGERSTIEYVLLAGVNDSADDARRLARFANRTASKINLIPYNPTGLPDFERASTESMEHFAHLLEPRVVAVTLRRSQGKDIFAACGQLAQSVPRRPRRSRRAQAKQAET